MIKKVFKIIFILFALSSKAQNVQIVTTVTQELTVCDDLGSNQIKITNNSSLLLSDVTLGVKMPVGIVYNMGSLNESTSHNITVISVVTDSGIVFSSDSLAIGDSIVFSFDFRAELSTIELQNNGTIFRNIASIQYDSGQTSANSNGFNILYPVLAILQVTPKNQTIISGTSTSRVVQIINGGNGRLSSFWLVDSRNGVEVSLDSTDIGQLSGDSLLLSNSDFSSIGNFDNYLDQNETIEVRQYLSGISCTDKTVTSTIQTHWGCSGRTIGSSTTFSNISIDFQTPSLSLSTSESFGSCFSAGTAYNQQLTIINKGSGVAADVDVEIYKSKGSSYNQDILSRIDVSSITYKLGVNGVVTSPVGLIETPAVDPSIGCLGSNPIGKVSFNIGALNPSDTLYVNWDMISCCIFGCGNQAVKGWKTVLDYSDVCGIKNYTVKKVGQNENEQYAAVFSEAPADIFDSITEEYSFILSSFINTLPVGSGAHYKVVFDLESGLLYDSLRLHSNGSIWTSSSIAYDLTQNTVTATYDVPEPFTIAKSEFELTLTGDCGSSGWKNITMNLYYIADTTCTSTCDIPLICSYQTSTYLHCPGANCNGLSFYHFAVSRNNFGSPDNDLDGLPDASGSLNLNQIKENRAMVGDTLIALAKAVVSTDTVTWDYAAFSSQVSYGSVLNIISATYILYDASVSTWDTFSNIPATTTINGTEQSFSVNLSENVLGSLNSAFTTFSYANGDSLKLEILYKVTDNVTGLLNESTFTNEFYLSHFATPTLAQKDQCTFRNGRITLLGYEFRNDNKNFFTLKNCSKTVKQNFGMSIGTSGTNYAGGNLFPYEYRHWSQMTEARVTIPDGYMVESARLNYYRTVKTNGTSKQTINNIVPDSTFGNTYLYDLGQYFDSGALLKSDDGYNGTLYLVLKPTCSGVPRGYEEVDWKFEYQKTDAIDGNSTGLISAIPDKVRYTPATLSLSSVNPIQDANIKSVNWDYKVKNTSNSNAENLWVYLEIPSTFTVDSIFNDNTNTIVAESSGFYELGILNAGKTADMTIYGTFSNCDTVIYTAYSGYSCDGYPTSFAAITCYFEELELKVEPKKAQYQVRISDELMADPCLPRVLLTLDITSVEIAHMYDMKATVISTDTSKIKIVESTTLFRSGTAAFVAAQDPTFSNNRYSFDFNDYESTYATNGIPGVLGIPNNNFKLQFTAETGINFQPGDYLQIQLEGGNACGDTLPTMNFAVDLNSKFEKDGTTGINLDIGDSWSASWGDYDNDGYDDLFVPINDITKPSILYHNNGDGTFSKLTSGNIVTDLGGSIAGTWGDYDNDGYIDLFVANNINSENKLYHNNGNGTFTSVTNSPIVDKGMYSHAAAWVDYNRDGNLDLVVSDFHPTHFNFLFLGDGTGGFTEDKISDVGLSATSAVGVAWGDYDNDGDPDLFIANTKGENNQLFRNEYGVLKEVFTGAIVSDGGTSVGGTWGDYDNDGDLDLFVTNSRFTEANFFYENDGDGTFTKIINSVITSNISNSHGASWIDYDNDGYLDLMVANDNNEFNFLFRNNGNRTFTKITNAITQENSDSYGTAWSDYDNDGDYDLVVANRGDNANDFFVNAKGSCTNHIVIELDGCNSNSKGIGALIKVKSTIYGVSLWQTKDVATQNSALGGQNSSKILFGLGDATSVDSIIIFWPSGIVTALASGTINALNTITEQCGSTVCGVVYHDANSNGVQDSSELGISNRSITVTPGNFQVFTGENGGYQFYLADGSYLLTLNADSLWSQTSPASNGSFSLTINNATQSEYCGNNFGNSTTCSSPDLTIYLGTTAMRRGLLNDLNVRVTNEGAYASSSTVTVELTMTSSVHLIDTTYSSVSLIGNLRTYTFNVGVISALSDTILYLKDSVDVSSSLNDTIEVLAKVFYSGSECDTLNNTASVSDLIVGSIDPNDKLVFISNNTEKNKNQAGNAEVLNYKIRFQNLGNYAARRVEIIDTLSPLLDWSTFQIESASHEFMVSIVNGVVTWVNENIELPDSASDEENSNGFVAFSVSPRINISPYTLVHNWALIQFDRNPYIETNDAPAMVGLSALKLKGNKAIIYPNPTLKDVTIILISIDKRPIEIARIEVFNVQGVKLNDLQPNQSKVSVNISELSQGTYVFRIHSVEGELFHEKVVKY